MVKITCRYNDDLEEVRKIYNTSVSNTTTMNTGNMGQSIIETSDPEKNFLDFISFSAGTVKFDLELSDSKKFQNDLDNNTNISPNTEAYKAINNSYQIAKKYINDN